MSDDNRPLSRSSGDAVPFELPSLKMTVAVLLLVLYVVVNAIGAIEALNRLVTENAQAARYGNMGGTGAALLSVNLWGLAAGLGLPLIVGNVFHLLNRARLTLGSTLVAMILGRAGGWLIANGLALAGVSGATGFLIVPFALALLGFFTILTLGLIALGLFGVVVGIPMAIFNSIFQFEHSLAVFRYQSDGLAGYIVRFVYWLRNQALPKGPPDDSKGARFAVADEIVALHAFDDPAAMTFGHVHVAPLRIKTDKHILIMASTRSGKGVTLIIPHLLTYTGSAFVLDPKGENAKATGRARAALNDTVHYLDPFGITGKPPSRFNPLSRFTPLNMEAESKALAAALFLVAEGDRDHWNASGQQLLAAVILYVYLSPDFPPDKKDLPAVRKILLGGLRDALKAMVLIDDADGLLRDLAMSFLETPEKEVGSIISTAQRQTEILDNPYIVACLSASGPGAEVDFKQWQRGTMTVYLSLSAPKFPTFNRWLRLVLTAALDEMTDTLNPPPLPVCFMLDELATLGHLQSVENAVGLAAGYGIQLVSVFQDVAQMRDLYKSRWASFIGNAGVRALFNLDDYDTAKYWSDFVGGRLVETRSQSQDIYGYSRGDNVGEAMRPLIPPDKLMIDYAQGKMLVLATGQHPVETKRVAYFDNEALAGLWDDPRVPTPAHERFPWALSSSGRPSGPPRPPTPPPGPPPASPPPAPRPTAPAASPAATATDGGRTRPPSVDRESLVANIAADLDGAKPRAPTGPPTFTAPRPASKLPDPIQPTAPAGGKERTTQDGSEGDKTFYDLESLENEMASLLQRQESNLPGSIRPTRDDDRER